MGVGHEILGLVHEILADPYIFRGLGLVFRGLGLAHQPFHVEQVVLNCVAGTGFHRIEKGIHGLPIAPRVASAGCG